MSNNNNKRFQNILDEFNSEDIEDENDITKKTKQINPKNKFDNKISENSNNENSEENIKIYYLNNIPLYSDRDNNHNEDFLNDSNKDINKNSLNKIIISNSNISELELKNSFRPKPIPNSPEFPKKSTEYNNNHIVKEINNKNRFNYNNNKNINNNNFTETLETKIEGDNLNQNQEKLITLDNIINGNKELEHNNFASLGTFTIKEKENNDNNSKNSEEIEKQKEQEFLKNEDYKIRKMKNQNQTKEEENGKENVEDEDIHDSGEINFNMNSKFEHAKFSRNKEDNNINIPGTQTTVPNRIKDISKQLFKQNENNIDNDKENGKKFIFNDINNNNDNNIDNNTNENNNNIIISKKEENNNFNSAKKNVIIKKIYTKIPVIKKTGIKNNKLNSPPQKNININPNNNSNYNSEIKDSSISSFNIYSSKINIINNKGIYAKKNLPELKNIKKKLNYTGIKQEERVRKTPIKKKQKISITPIRQRKLETVKYSFTPLINKKSRKIWEKRNKKLEEKLNSSEKGGHSNSNKKCKPKFYEILNNIGAQNKEKLNQQDLTEKNNIKLIANQKKINLNSYEMAKKRMYKKLDQIIEKYKNEENLSIVNMVQCLCCMRIINELIKIDQIKDLNLKIIKDAIKSIKNGDKKKFEELEFIQQFWLKMNPSLEEYIKVELFSEFIKILFVSEKSKIKKYSEDIEKLLLQNKINIDSSKEGIYVAPLQNKTFETKDIWTIPKLIKSFLKLKSDLKGYKNINYELKMEKYKNDLIEDRDKELTFEPDLSKSNNYVFKNAKYKDYNTNKENLNDSYTDTSRIKKTNFNKIYERFMEEKKMKEEAIKLMREIKKEKEIKKCTLRPKINEYKPRKSYLNNRLNKSVDISINNNNKKISIFERLYSLRKIYNQKKIKLDENEELGTKFNSKRSYKDNNNNISNSKNKVIKPILAKREINNYVIKNKNLNNNINKNVDTNKIYLKKNTKMKMNHFNITKENDNNIIDNISVIMEIKIPNGKSKPFKVYKNQNINESVEEFCKNNRINKEDKKAIYNQAIYFKNNIFGRNTYESNYAKKNLEDNFLSDNVDTNTNAYD